MSKAPRKRRKHGAAQGKRKPLNQRQTQPAKDTDSQRDLKTMTRRQLRLIWEMAQLGGPLKSEDARTVQVMREHPEYADLWPRLDTVSDAELERDGTNPILHIIIHTTLENQLADHTPPLTGEVMEILLAQGLSRHEAAHRIGKVILEEIFGVLTSDRPFNPVEFERKLRELTRD